MARIRTIKPEFWTSEQIVECSTNARLLFIGLWNFCDDGGVHHDSIKRIKMEVFPGDDFSSKQIAGWICELVEVGLLERYSVDDQCYLHVSGWNNHQKIDRPNPKYPTPDSTNARRTLDEPSPPEGKGRETEGKRKGREGIKKGHFVPPTIEAVRAYCEEKGYTFDAEVFVAYYGSQGWKKANGQKVTSWERCCVTFQRSRPGSGPPARKSAQAARSEQNDEVLKQFMERHDGDDRSGRQGDEIIDGKLAKGSQPAVSRDFLPGL